MLFEKIWQLSSNEISKQPDHETIRSWDLTRCMKNIIDVLKLSDYQTRSLYYEIINLTRGSFEDSSTKIIP